tara:strand:- start:84 stop:881 length:798 start_codon:yes stop_codon:yes gene_type:complete
MSIMDFFTSQGTASPSPDSERGDWMDWFLNREGAAGRFKGSRRPRYGIDYLFNGGGSVRSRPRRSVQSGPRPRQKLQPTTDPNWAALSAASAGAYGGRRTPDDIRQESINLGQRAGLGNRISFAGEGGRDILNPNEMRVNAPSVENWKQKAQRKMMMDRMYQVEDNPYYGQDQDWGIMAFNDPAVNQMKDDYLGHRLFDTGWGQGLLGHWANKFGGEGDVERLEEVLPDLGDKRGWLGADWDFDIGKDNFGVNATWNLQDLFRRG